MIIALIKPSRTRTYSNVPQILQTQNHISSIITRVTVLILSLYEPVLLPAHLRFTKRNAVFIETLLPITLRCPLLQLRIPDTHRV